MRVKARSLDVSSETCTFTFWRIKNGTLGRTACCKVWQGQLCASPSHRELKLPHPQPLPQRRHRPLPPAAAPAAPTWSVGAIDFSGYLDGYFSYNSNRPASQTNQFYNFDDEDQFNLEAAKLTLNHDPDPVGAHVDILFGRTNSFLHCSACDQTLNYIEQAYISVKTPQSQGL